MAGSSGIFTIKNQKGVTYNDDSNKKWNIEASCDTKTGFNALLIGELDKSDKFKIWKLDSNGVFKKSSKWKTAVKGITKGVENKFNADIDGNGLITNKKTYKLSSSLGAIELKNKKGKVFQIKGTKNWDATAAFETENGFKVLLTGAKSSYVNGKVKKLIVDKDGITQWSGKWKNISWATAKGWENEFQVDLNNNNIIETNMSSKSSSDLLINPSTQSIGLSTDVNQNTEYISANLGGLAPQEASDMQIPLITQSSSVLGSNANMFLKQNENFLL